MNKSLPGRQRTDVHWEGVCANVKTDVVRERTNRGPHWGWPDSAQVSMRAGQNLGCSNGSQWALPAIPRGGTHVIGFQTLFKWQNPLVKTFLASTLIRKLIKVKQL